MKFSTAHFFKKITIGTLGLIIANSVYADIRLAVFDFELVDLTSLPNTQGEISRTATIKPLLDEAINRFGGYQTTAVAEDGKNLSRPAIGYWYRFPDEAAKRGADAGSDWVVVGRHSKPSFLYSYLMVELIEVKTQRLMGSFSVELKGNHPLVMQHGVKRLAELIDRVIRAETKLETGLKSDQ